MRAKKPQNSVERYKPMSEAMFRELGGSNAIKAVEALRVDGGVYWVLIYVRFNAEPQLLFTTRNHPRVWLSLDRLAAYLEKIWLRCAGFSVVMGKRNTAVPRVEAGD